MATNVYFQNLDNFGEQNLIEDLVIESIKIYGHDVYYCPRTLVAKDDVYGEDAISEYNNSYFVEMYIKSFDAYEGDGTFLSKFNIQIRDQMRFVIARRTFNDEVGSNELIDRPQEGDLIYSPMMKRVFVIMYVNNKPVFYQMGALQMYELTCEVWEYSNERLNTGIPEIDSLEDKYSSALEHFNLRVNDGTLVDSNGQPVVQGQYDFDKQHIDVLADNDEILKEEQDEDLVDWNESNPFGPI